MDKRLFLIFIVIIPALQFFLLRPILESGYGPDDWGLLYAYKSLVGDSNPIVQIGKVLQARGIHSTPQVYYVGLLEEIFGLDFQAFQIVNIVFKTIATLFIYFLVNIVFKRQSLAFVTAILFTLSYTSTGTFKFVSQGFDYLALSTMSVFLMIYYYSIKHFKYTVLLPLFLTLTLILSPSRIYPLLFLLPIIEIYRYFISQKKFGVAISGIGRLLLIFLPLIVAALLNSDQIIKTNLFYFNYIEELVLRLKDGYWYVILNPLTGIGVYFAPLNVFLSVFGNLNNTDFYRYFFTTPLKYFLAIYLIKVILSKLIFKSSRVFFKKLLLAHIITIGLFYFIINHNSLDYSTTYLTAQLFGIFILELAIFSFIEWKNRSEDVNSLLLPIWIGPWFSFIFLYLTWILAYAQNYREPHNYLMIPSVGLSLFLSGVLLLIHQHDESRKKIVSQIIMGVSIVVFFLFNKSEIDNYFTTTLTGWKASDQIRVQENIVKLLKDNLSEPTLVFFDLSDVSVNYNFYDFSALSTFPFWTNYYLKTDKDSSCRATIYGKKENLFEFLDKKSNDIQFKTRAFCISSGIGYYEDTLFDLDHFYSYKVKNEKLINHKSEVIDYLLTIKEK